MKTLLTILLLLSLNAHAEFKFSMNLLTMHTFSRGNFANRLDDKGIFITNKMFFIEKKGVGIILGEDSAGVFVYGGFLELPLNINKIGFLNKSYLVNKFSLVLGAYSYNRKEWERDDGTIEECERIDAEYKKCSYNNKRTYKNEIGNKLGFMPIVGIKYNIYKYKIMDLDLFVSPATINLLIGGRF